MKRFLKWGIVGIFSAVAAAPALAQSKEFNVIHVDVPAAPRVVILPDRELPPGPGQRRQAAERWVRDIPAVIDSYTLLLRDDAGGYVQCAGVRVDAQMPDEAKMMDYLSFEPLATSLPLLRLMHAAPKAAAWPVRLGGCTAVSVQEIGDKEQHMMQLRLGPDVVLDYTLPVYGYETGDQMIERRALEISGGISAKGNAVFRCTAAGWRDDLHAAQPGMRVKLPGLCPN
jgi:hypothetical protein